MKIEREEIFVEEQGWDNLDLHRIEFSNGRVFEHRLTESKRGDSWGCDRYEFVELGKNYYREEIYHEGWPNERKVERFLRRADDDDR